MSETLFLGLPRFDSEHDAAPAPAAGNWQRPLEDDIPQLIQEAPLPMVQIEVPEPETAPEAVDLSHVEASLAALGARLERMEQQGREQVFQQVHALSARLFPLLAEQFLAEEISRHLDSLVPASAVVVEIRAEASLAEKLRTSVERIPSLVHRCTITPTSQAGQGQVDVSWHSGGLSFDFDRLLASCLSHLKTSDSQIKE
jgi:hypothetical protein